MGVARGGAGGPGTAELAVPFVGTAVDVLMEEIDDALARRGPSCCPEPAAQVSAERQRIAGALHDEVGPLLFAIAAGTQRARALHPGDPAALLATITRVEQQVLAASDRLRAILRSASPGDPVEAVPAAAQRDLDDLAERSDVDTRLVVRGRVRPLSREVERAALHGLRQALFNVERHAAARSVVVTLDYGTDAVDVVVQDDGRGPPPGFRPGAVPTGESHWGFASMARRVEQLGGTVRLAGPADGPGTRMHLRLPSPGAAA